MGAPSHGSAQGHYTSHPSQNVGRNYTSHASQQGENVHPNQQKTLHGNVNKASLATKHLTVTHSIDPCSLAGLRMAVPHDWWNGCRGKELSKGCIAEVNLDAVGEKYFMLKLDEDEDPDGTLWPMRYDAVKEYADKSHDDFSKYHLPARLVMNPEHRGPKVCAYERCLYALSFS